MKKDSTNERTKPASRQANMAPWGMHNTQGKRRSLRRCQRWWWCLSPRRTVTVATFEFFCSRCGFLCNTSMNSVRKDFTLFTVCGGWDVEEEGDEEEKKRRKTERETKQKKRK
jgi:hypothetical protein